MTSKPVASPDTPGPADTAETVTADEVGQLLVAVGQGDRLAFRRLYQLTSPAIFAGLRRMLVQASLAEDVLQDVYVSVWQRAASYNPAFGAGMAWLRTLARHRAIDLLRALRRQGVADAELRSLPQPVAEQGRQSMGWVLWRSVDALPPPQREAMLLIYVRGYTQAEVAEQMGLPLGTVKSWVRRALIRLAQELDASP